jgi:hypothetical protein
MRDGTGGTGGTGGTNVPACTGTGGTQPYRGVPMYRCTDAAQSRRATRFAPGD